MFISASGFIYITLFATALGVTDEISSVIIILVFFFGNGFAKKSLKQWDKKASKHSKFILLARSKVNSIGNIMSKAPTDAKIINEEFKLINNEAKKYRKLKEIIRLIEIDRLIEDGKKLGVDERIDQIEKNNDNLKWYQDKVNPILNCIDGYF